jgi:hypothetical protein
VIPGLLICAWYSPVHVFVKENTILFEVPLFRDSFDALMDELGPFIVCLMRYIYY